MKAGDPLRAAALVAVVLLPPPAAAQDADAGAADFTQPGYSSVLQVEGMVIPLNRADSDRLAVGLARRYLAEGRYGEAVEILSIAQRRRPRDQDVEALLTRAEAGLVRELMAVGAFAEAMAVLSVAERRRPADRDVQILLAQAQVALGRPEDAIARLQALTTLHPDWPRPRVELALAHAAAGHVRKAKRILIAELGKDPPPDVRRNIEMAIRQLEDRQGFVGRISAGVVPDSNVTGGTYNTTIQYLGLPFTPNDDAKQQSGVRGRISAGGTLRTGWKENTRLEVSLDLAHSEPLGDEGTPSSNARLGAAARVRGPKGSMRVGVAAQPFYWDNELQRVEGSVFLEAGRRIGQRTSLVGNLTLSDGTFNDAAERDFRQWEAGIGPGFALSPDTWLQVTGIFGDRNAESDLYSFIRRGVSASLVTTPADGWRLYAAGGLTRDVYGEESLAFGTTQEDLITIAFLEVVKTGWVFWGFSPSVGLGYSEVRSTIDLYDKRSFTFNLGFALPY